MKKNIRLKIKHNKKCCIAGTKDMYWCFQRIFWASIAGNEKAKWTNSRWLEFRCNDPDCSAIVIVKEEEITDLITSHSSFGGRKI